jgi:hypothetical protein
MLRGEIKIAEKIRKMGAFVAGIILVVLGALMLAEGVITLMGNPAFLFVDNMNRGFELVVGLVTIIVAAATMDSSRV